MEAIQYKGLEEINAEQRAVLDKLSAEYYDKIKRALRNENCSISIHIKKYESKGGGEGKEKKHAKFSINLLAMAPTKTFESSAADWDFARTLHKVFKDMETEISHHFKKMFP